MTLQSTLRHGGKTNNPLCLALFLSHFHLRPLRDSKVIRKSRFAGTVRNLAKRVRTLPEPLLGTGASCISKTGKARRRHYHNADKNNVGFDSQPKEDAINYRRLRAPVINVQRRPGIYEIRRIAECCVILTEEITREREKRRRERERDPCGPRTNIKCVGHSRNKRSFEKLQTP